MNRDDISLNESTGRHKCSVNMMDRDWWTGDHKPTTILSQFNSLGEKRQK